MIYLFSLYNMKRRSLYDFLFFLISLFVFASCTKTDNGLERDIYTGVPVTVVGSELSEYKLYTDNDIWLNPTNISNVQGLKYIDRAVIGFSLYDEGLTLDKLKPNSEYDILLVPTYCSQLPTFINLIDVSSDDYLESGQDSLTLKNQKMQSVDNNESFYVANGYVNITGTFAYSSTEPTRFSLFYDSKKDLDADSNKISLNLYYNVGSESSTDITKSSLCFKLPNELYAKFKDANISDNDMIDITLNVSTIQNGDVEMTTTTYLSDFLLP